MPHAQTFETLARSRNEAATAVLLAALESDDRRAFDGAALALVRRRSKAGHLAVLARWHELSDDLKRAIDQSEGRMGGALHDALLSPDEQLFANACEVARESGEFDLAPTLISVAEQTEGPRSAIATALVLELVDRLAHAADEPDAGGYSRHPETIRKGVLESLERSVERFAIHGKRELIEAFVTLAGPESSTLRAVLEAPHHPCFQTVYDVLNLSTNPAVLDLLTSYLANHEAPGSVRQVVARRTDPPFVAALLGMPLPADSSWLAKNMAGIKALACLASGEAVCKRTAPAGQAAAMRLTSLSGATDETKLDFAAALLARGAQLARLAACESLSLITGQRSNDLVLAALADEDGDVQAAATRQLRSRHIPGTMAKLLELVASPFPQVQAAARESLAEFSFENYMARYETLDNESRRSTGALVALIDMQAIDSLKLEMASPVRRRRLRAIEVAEIMNVTAKVADALVERLDDEDHMVRAAAAAALADCTAMDVRDALVDALSDRSFAVQTAARESLRLLGVEAHAGNGESGS
ncbi:MAG TPA: HEAT repeat domain-containing protein [Lacipirellulaceae bacterium]|nr:HEAT repeat domain-containing protein [Lacipirellulaceae bacterium]